MSVSLWIHDGTGGPDEDSLNFTNDNFLELMHLLGVNPQTESGLVGTFDPAAAARMLVHLEQALLLVQSCPGLDTGQAARIDLTPGRVTVIHLGHIPGWYAMRLSSLKRLLTTAIAQQRMICYA